MYQVQPYGQSLNDGEMTEYTTNQNQYTEDHQNIFTVTIAAFLSRVVSFFAAGYNIW